MICNRWKLFSAIALTLSVQSVLAGEAWLVITSEYYPGTAISVDDAYRGVTPQRSGGSPAGQGCRGNPQGRCAGAD